jgi:molybdenum cofactor cytidylyltransferase
VYTTDSQTGLVILAAGASTRMGRPKQLLTYRNRSFVRHAVDAALGSVCDPVVVVVGANAELVRNELEDCCVFLIENRAWESGMGSSVLVGLRKLLSLNNEVEGVVIMLCDQPFVTSEVIDRLVDTRRRTQKMIVASQYGSTRGVPALFGRELFSDLAALEPAEGARKIITKYPGEVATIEFAEGAIDIDTPGEYEELTG